MVFSSVAVMISLSSVTMLPQELLEYIFVHVSDPQHLVLTCKRFFIIGQSASIRLRWLKHQFPLLPRLHEYAAFQVFRQQSGYKNISRVKELVRHPVRLLSDALLAKMVLAFDFTETVENTTIRLLDQEQVDSDLRKSHTANSTSQLFPAECSLPSTNSDSRTVVNTILRFSVAVGYSHTIEAILHRHACQLTAKEIGIALAFAFASGKLSSIHLLLDELEMGSIQQIDITGVDVAFEIFYHLVTDARLGSNACTLVKRLLRILPAAHHVGMLDKCLYWFLTSPPVSRKGLVSKNSDLSCPSYSLLDILLNIRCRTYRSHPQQLPLTFGQLSESALLAFLQSTFNTKLLDITDPFIRYDLLQGILCQDREYCLRYLVQIQKMDPRFDSDWCLRFACMSGSIGCTQFLVNECMVDVAVGGGLVIREASASGNGEILGLLLRNASSPIPVKILNASLIIAAENNQIRTSELLLQYGADPRADGYMPLRIAICRGYKEVLDVLTRCGAASSMYGQGEKGVMDQVVHKLNLGRGKAIDFTST
ncbi:uncharacterized protein SPPG_00896 [Spizellomyces punctatus DAOM BR117]|uniref:F-box domain-containing protein n=1 Tax=Spizellomyces punctatus (strain DAOM BR117) TaxID=645134 RepID=A0A0L0HR47_SPIPD|nr:uncharacterized protein SPPG_00896 [Spizellomyces punctatus DAOM BR117]KND03410.1 hypothetical protein SPPG_00896 [Spizellomyces punctatus DAOM BR117]|eukprot:XP_016611449.1 hypothetical protein SPPG_00896 [Spizellomyces punctatus DAOM BR117]